MYLATCDEYSKATHSLAQDLQLVWPRLVAVEVQFKLAMRGSDREALVDHESQHLRKIHETERALVHRDL
jgi:hypothetical protein